MKVLIVEDESALANGLKFNFEQEGYEVVLAADGPTALECFQSDDAAFDLVILDLMLPGVSGYETCRAIRAIDNQVPVLVLSARTLSEDKAQAFDCGTDQYMTKPFALPELLSRVRNLIERSSARTSATSNGNSRQDVYEFAGIRVDFDKFEVTVGQTTHNLTTMEMQLLCYFIENEALVLSRAQILKDVWGETADITTRSIDNFVMRLRKLIEANPTEPRHIRSVRGTGYRFIANPNAAATAESAK